MLPAMDASIVFYVLAAVLILIGLAGTVLPVLPGVPLMFIGMVIVAWLGDFTVISGQTLLVLGLATALTIGIDVVATILGARRVGASRKAMLGAGMGTLIGVFFGLPGLLAGPYLGAMAGEMAHGREWRHASRIGFGTWIGMAIGAVLKVGLALAMLALFGLALWLP